MAKAILGDCRFDGKPAPTSFYTSLKSDKASPSSCVLDGLVQHDDITVDVQVGILGVIDATGSAPLVDIIAALTGHPRPVSAVQAMVHAQVVQFEPGLIDANTRVSRAGPVEPDASVDEADDGSAHLKHDDVAVVAPPQSDRIKVREILAPCFAPAIFFCRGTDRARMLDETSLSRPGIYIAVWNDEAYIGASKSVSDRVAGGRHLIDPRLPDAIIAIVDRTGQLSWNDALVAERILFRMVGNQGELRLRHDMPKGAAIDAAGYQRVVDFVETAFAALKREGIQGGITADFLSAEHGKSVRVGTGMPDDNSAPALRLGPGATEQAVHPVIYQLDACGVEATTQVVDGKWTVLAGSGVRGAVMPSAHSSATQRRVELLHSGGLVERGDDYVLTHDLTFGSATGAAHFILGCKTRADIWEAVDNTRLASPQR